MSQSVEHQVQALVEFFEQLQPADLPRFAQLYAPQAYFRDPFNEVRGTDEIVQIFHHMYQVLDQPHFLVGDRIVQGRQCFLVWDFRFRFKRRTSAPWQSIAGSSHLRFDDQGRVEYHRDYWDAAQELYEKLPVLGGFMRWLRRQAAG